MTIERTNTYVSYLTIFGWWEGLAWFAYNEGGAGLGIVWWLALIFGGMIVVSIVIGGGLAVVFGLLTRLAFGRWDAASTFYAWGAVIGPVVSFLLAEPAIQILQGQG